MKRLHCAAQLFSLVFVGAGARPKSAVIFLFFLESLRAAVPGNRPSAQPVDFRLADIFAHSPPPEDAGNGRA